MGFSYKVDNSKIVDTLEQLLNRKDREIFSTDVLILQNGTLDQNVLNH